MEEKIPRRGLLARLGVGASSLIALPLLGKAALNLNDDTMTDNQQHPILKVRPLGFQWETLDPFLFCVHHDDHFPKGNEKMGPAASLDGRHIGQDFILKDGWRMYHGETVPGFPYHPHRGFETITVVRKGLVDHFDSTGAAGRYGNGDVQWMTAGGGVQHSEMFPLLRTDSENPMELFQIWLNLPRKSKMVKPHFLMMWHETIPHVEMRDANGKLTETEVILGSLAGRNAPTPPPDSWANDPNNHVAIWNIRLEEGATFTVPKTVAGINRTLYIYQGDELKVADRAIATYHAAEVRPEQDVVLRNGKGEARVLLLQGRPINEPVVQHGPFVMNTREEIQQAFQDYQRTQFGGWPWDRRDPVHDRERGRFARHSDGRIEDKG
jgi:redox-sensitive bicupin YhaK (pirin superfamily)